MRPPPPHAAPPRSARRQEARPRGRGGKALHRLASFFGTMVKTTTASGTRTFLRVRQEVFLAGVPVPVEVVLHEAGVAGLRLVGVEERGAFLDALQAIDELHLVGVGARARAPRSSLPCLEPWRSARRAPSRPSRGRRRAARARRRRSPTRGLATLAAPRPLARSSDRRRATCRGGSPCRRPARSRADRARHRPGRSGAATARRW